MKRLEGKIAIVTGASKGIGASIAEAFGDAGASVVVNYVASKDDADRVVAAIAARGGRAIAVQADMSKPEDVRRLFAETKRARGGLDILVNNAGVYQFDALERFSEAEYRRQFDTNVLGPIVAVQESLGLFGPKGGSVINISSIASTNRAPGALVYAATKAALDAMTRVLSRELGPRKIRVNSIAPGPIETEGVARLGIIDAENEALIVSQTPLGRFGQPADVARVALFFASDDSAWVTGEQVRVAGGFV